MPSLSPLSPLAFPLWIQLSNVWPWVGWERLGCSWRVTKSVIKQKAKPFKFLPQNFVISWAKKSQSGFFTRANTLVAPKMFDFAPKRNAFLPYWVFFLHLPLDSVRTVGVQSYAAVITKFYRIHRFPQFSLGLRFRCARSARSTPVLTVLTPCVCSGKLCAGVANIYLFYLGLTAHALLSNLNFASGVLYIYFIAKCCAPSKLQLKKRCL